MILGIASVPMLIMFPFAAIIVGVVGLVMGFVGLRQTANREGGRRGRGFAVAGVATSAVAVIISAAIIVLTLVYISNLSAQQDVISDTGETSGILVA